jgi:hypothetical protein
MRWPMEWLMRAYLNESQKPLPSLLLVLPLIAIYETASRGMLGGIDSGPADQLVAFSLLRKAFVSLGAHGAMLPALALIACLLGWHIAKRDRWKVKPLHLGGMAMEGCLLALPLTAMALLAAKLVPFAAMHEPVPRMAVLSVGAAIYEELLFRLVGFVLFSLFFVDLLGIRQRVGDCLSVVLSAALFAAYHYLGIESFSWSTCGFRFVAGLFLGALFHLRGFGVTAFCHAAYDIYCVVICAYVSRL